MINLLKYKILKLEGNEKCRSLNLLHFQILVDVEVNAGPVFLVQFADPGEHGHVIPEIVLLVVVIGVDLEDIFDDIDEGLEVHFKHVDLFLVLFDLFFVDVALVHELVFVFLFYFLFLHCKLVYLK